MFDLLKHTGDPERKRRCSEVEGLLVGRGSGNLGSGPGPSTPFWRPTPVLLTSVDIAPSSPRGPEQRTSGPGGFQ